MPIVFELVVMMLVAYGSGLALGWAAWGRTPRREPYQRHAHEKGEPEE